MTVSTEYIYVADLWIATDDDQYDGAPDSGPRAHAMGYGETEQGAVDDLRAQLAEFDEEEK